MDTTRPIQDFYEDELAICYGCGRLNEHGLHIQTFWDGEEGISRFTPKPYHTAYAGYTYGGLLASLIDCNGTGTAAAAMHAAQAHDTDDDTDTMSIRCVTASLKVDYLKPTPIDGELVLRSRVKELRGRKAIITVSVYAGEVECVRGEVTAVRVRG